MSQESNQAVVLLPIHPIYARRIMDGSKRVEFRRVAFSKEVYLVLIYATSPESEVVGMFQVAKMESNTPEELWSIYHDVAGIHKDEYDKYFLGCDKGIAIQIKKAVQFRKPIALSELDVQIHPPRGFQYIPQSWLNEVNIDDLNTID